MIRTDEMTELALRELRQALLDTRGLGRRAFIQRLGGAAAAWSLLGGLAKGVPGAEAQGKPVTTIGWGGTWKDACYSAYYDPWTKRTGTPVKYVTPFEFAKVRAMHEAGRMEIDVIDPGSVDSPRAVKFGMVQKLDWKIIDKSALTPNQFKYGDLGIGSNSLSTVLVYNKKKWPGADHPKSWADFWDVKKFPGPRALQRRAYPNFEYALMADGMPPDTKKIYPIDVERAFKSLDRIKKHVTVWWETGAQQQQLIQDGEVDLIAMWNGRASDSIAKGAPYEIVWNQAAYNGNVSSWMVLKGAPNPEGGMKLLDWVGRAEPQAAFAKLLFYGPLNLKAYELLDKKTSEQLPSYPGNVAKSLLVDLDWWQDRFDALTERYERWLQS